ncbi:MAG TPA: carboxyl transferase domain-containing protein, partial [Stenomitos sp.]
MAEQTLTGMAAAVADLKKRREQAKQMGAPEAIEQQHAAGKLTARERLDLLFDPRTFEEWGLHASHPSPADGVITGIGKVNGRLVAVIAYDATVMGDALGPVGETKASRIRETALRQGIPIVWLLDSASVPVQAITGSGFAGSGKLFHDQARMSGSVPQVAALMGHCAAETAYIPALADFVPMVKGTSSLALAAPPQVHAATGETV